jgi:hypothetical protein
MSVAAFYPTALAVSGLFMSLSCTALAGDASHAGPEQPLPPALADVAKLTLHDGAVDKGLRAAGAPSPPVLTPEQKLGLSRQRIEELESPAGHAQEPTELHAHIAHISSDGSGHMLFVLDNSQVWRQADVDFNFVARSGDAATISEGALGSYWLAVNAHSGIKVKRLK